MHSASFSHLCVLKRRCFHAGNVQAVRLQRDNTAELTPALVIYGSILCSFALAVYYTDVGAGRLHVLLQLVNARIHFR